jgi:hypothetical protein
MQEFYLFLNHLETPQLLMLVGLRAFGAIVSGYLARQTEPVKQGSCIDRMTAY